MNDRPRPQTSRYELSWAQRWVAHHAILEAAGLDRTTTDAETDLDSDLLAALESTPVELDADQRRTLRDAVTAYLSSDRADLDRDAAEALLASLSD